MKKTTLIALCLLLISIGRANQDSLWSVYTDPKTEPEIKCNVLGQLTWSLMFSNTDSAFRIGELMLTEANKTGKEEYLVDAYDNLGIASTILGHFSEAIDYYDQSVPILINTSNHVGLAMNYSNKGIAYAEMGNYKKALSNYLWSLKLFENVADTTSSKKQSDEIESTIASSNTNIGLIYAKLKQYKIAEEHYGISLKTYQKLGKKDRQANVLSNYANMFHSLNLLEKAESYHRQALDLRISIGDVYGEATSYTGLGQLSLDLNKIEAAENYFSKSVELYDGLGAIVNSSAAKIGLADILLRKKEYADAVPLCEDLYKTGQATKSTEIVSESCECLHVAYRELGQSTKALEYYEEHILIRDSLINEENVSEMLKQGYQYEYEKQKAVDEAQRDKEVAIEKEKKEKQRVLTGAVSIGLGLVVLFLAFVFNRLRITRRQKNDIGKQKEVIENAHKETRKQKHIIEEAHTEITDSINYAKRLQDAILPSFNEVTKHLPNNFILFKPKDIVSGDFYWMESVGNSVIFAAADCTGHGVPGAMLSMLCNNALNRAVREYGLNDPGQILDKTRSIIIEDFEKSEDQVKDGMDISLCSLSELKLEFAGAYNNMWVVRKGEIIEIKADRQPIGNYDNPIPFTTQSFDLQKGDILYIFSDGYVDQFGGKNGKKLKSKKFRNIVLGVTDKPMAEQKGLLDDALKKWRGDLEQVDDVCMIGVRV